MLDLSSLLYVGGAGLVIALVQVIKSWVKNDSLYPILAMLFGIIINVTIGRRVGIDLTTNVFAGIITGLLACGIYSTTGTGKPPTN